MPWKVFVVEKKGRGKNPAISVLHRGHDLLRKILSARSKTKTILDFSRLMQWTRMWTFWVPISSLWFQLVFWLATMINFFFLVLQALVKMCSKLSLVDKLCRSVNIDKRMLLARVLLTIGDVHTSYHSIWAFHLWNRASGSSVLRAFAQKLTMKFSVALSGRARDKCNFFPSWYCISGSLH